MLFSITSIVEDLFACERDAAEGYAVALPRVRWSVLKGQLVSLHDDHVQNLGLVASLMSKRGNANSRPDGNVILTKARVRFAAAAGDRAILLALLRCERDLYGTLNSAVRLLLPRDLSLALRMLAADTAHHEACLQFALERSAGVGTVAPAS